MLSQAHRTIIALTGVLAGRAECLSRLREKHGFISFKLLKSGLQSFAESNANIKTSLFRFDISALAVARCNAREAPSNAKIYTPNSDSNDRAAVGGAEEDRTPDPLRARQVLSQLSYTPMKALSVPAMFCDHLCGIYLVGLDRFELSTSRLSGVRSNQLSYRPARLAVH